MVKEDFIEPTNIQMLEARPFQLVGCVFFGDPFHAAKGWTMENEIGLLWQRFMKLAVENQDLLLRQAADPLMSYEAHIESVESKETRKYHVFVGMEVRTLEELPLEMFAKILPKTKYAIFSFRGEGVARGGDYIWGKWLPDSAYEESFPYMMQAYHRERYQGLGHPDSEVDYYIPVKKKAGGM